MLQVKGKMSGVWEHIIFDAPYNKEVPHPLLQLSVRVLKCRAVAVLKIFCVPRLLKQRYAARIARKVVVLAGASAFPSWRRVDSEIVDDAVGLSEAHQSLKA